MRFRVNVSFVCILTCLYMYICKVYKSVTNKYTLTSEKGKFPFTLYRKQFPIKVCYAMTINKSQGQTIDYVGLDLEDDVFSHGMAYVGFSRVKTWDNIRVAVNKARGNRIKNEVWKEVLLGEDD